MTDDLANGGEHDPAGQLPPICDARAPQDDRMSAERLEAIAQGMPEAYRQVSAWVAAEVAGQVYLMRDLLDSPGSHGRESVRSDGRAAELSWATFMLWVPGTCLSSRSELALVIERFIESLREHREEAGTTGHAPFAFAQSRLLDKLSRTLYVRVPEAVRIGPPGEPICRQVTRDGGFLDPSLRPAWLIDFPLGYDWPEGMPSRADLLPGLD